MDFGDVLNEWEHIKRDRKGSSAADAARAAAPDSPRPQAPAEAKPAELKPAAAKPRAPKPTAAMALEAWLDAHEIEPKDADREADRAERREKTDADARIFASMRSQDALDLHGMTAEEATAAIAAFLEASSRKGLVKVLVIHGKGLHSDGAPVLKKAARRAIESSRLAGRFGEAAKEEGGSGAMWVMIRRGK